MSLLVSKAGKSGCRINVRRATLHCSMLLKNSKHSLKLVYRFTRVEKSAKAERKDLTRKQGGAETKPRKDNGKKAK